jgi:hypothetical protein
MNLRIVSVFIVLISVMSNFKKNIQGKPVLTAMMITLLGISAFPVFAAEKAVSNDCGSHNVAAYEVHEWGVIVGCDQSEDYLLTSRPLRINFVKEPVLYFHSKDKKPFALRVTFNQGNPTETYPEATKNGNTLSWERVAFTAATPPVETKGLRLFDAGLVNFNEIIDTLNDVDADEVESNGVKARFLFYEGEMPFVNQIKTTYDVTTKKATVVNNGVYPVYDLFVLVPDGLDANDFIFPRDPLLAYLPQLKPGETVRVQPEAITKKVDFAKSLRDLGFTDKESAAFDSLWSESFLRSGKLLYRLPQDECDRLINLEFTPCPQKISRALYVLVKES